MPKFRLNRNQVQQHAIVKTIDVHFLWNLGSTIQMLTDRQLSELHNYEQRLDYQDQQWALAHRE
ncbi:hypothetical protein ACRYI5_08205 [Furfurilactobacillus sp. WILCCON 0119]|uniref:hypothetical protein n=1 Tax=Furfurilactobacillus entadae TaxID=2922307 RepID=UPI0035E72715